MYVEGGFASVSYVADHPTLVRLPSKKIPTLSLGFQFGTTTSTLVPECRVI
jgi:hypothetical protein